MILGNFYKYLGHFMHNNVNGSMPLKSVKSMSGELGIGTSYAEYFCRFGATESYAPSMSRVSTSLSSTNTGIIFGSGNTAPTLDDYCLSGDMITTISTSVGMTEDLDEQGNPYVSSVITITNTGSETITIGECGLYIYAAGGSGSLRNVALLERTALDTPITLEPNGVGQITYTVKLNYPTV